MSSSYASENAKFSTRPAKRSNSWAEEDPQVRRHRLETGDRGAIGFGQVARCSTAPLTCPNRLPEPVRHPPLPVRLPIPERGGRGSPRRGPPHFDVSRWSCAGNGILQMCGRILNGRSADISCPPRTAWASRSARARSFSARAEAMRRAASPFVMQTGAGVFDTTFDSRTLARDLRRWDPAPPATPQRRRPQGGPAQRPDNRTLRIGSREALQRVEERGGIESASRRAR